MDMDLNAAMTEFDVGFGPMMPDADIIHTGRVPTDTYVSAERFEKEMEVFRRVWLNVALDSEVPNVGDWVTRDIEGISASVVIVRGQDDQIRAFHNICSHRALKLVWGERGCDKRFVCPYHAWSYDTDGKLRGIPDRQAFPDIDIAESSLVPVSCEVWKGLIFINLDPNPRQTLRQFLGGVVDMLDKAPLDAFRYSARLTGIVKSNWKSGLDAASEGYHVQTLHRDSAKDMVCSKENPHVRPLSINFMGPHRRTSNPRNPQFQLSDAKPIHKMVFETIPQVVVAGEDKSLSFEPHGLNPTGHPLWSNDLMSIFPNFQLSLALNGFWSMHYWPISVDSFRWEAHYHFRDAPRTWREKFALESSIAFNRDISSEDTACTQQQQVAMKSGVRAVVQFGVSELLCRHQAAVMEAIVGQKSAETSMAIAAE